MPRAGLPWYLGDRIDRQARELLSTRDRLDQVLTEARQRLAA